MSDMPAMSREKVRRVDAWAIQTLGIAGIVLMENAGRCAADVAVGMLNRVASPTVAVLTGSGNNAGDGFVIARHLLTRHVSVDVYLLAPSERIRGDARINLEILPLLGIAPIQWGGRSAGAMADTLRGYDLLVDALGGTGIVGALRGDMAAAVDAANEAGPPILAVDIPTGLDCDTGRPQGAVIRAACTVTFVAPKLGFAADGADRYTGEVIVADIGIPGDRAE
jgi:NAD(P)H-hydrate epimerase